MRPSKTAILVLVVALAIGTTACNGGDAEDPIDDPAPDLAVPVCLPAEPDDPAPDFIGLDQTESEALATERGLTLRVVGVDGDCLVVTSDLRTDRVNVELAGDVVIAAAIY